jgi:hypothetical protein
MPTITHVRKADAKGHHHITHVRTKKGKEWRREDVYDSIRSGMKRWRSQGTDGGTKAKIDALDTCPRCDAAKFIRSSPDASKKNNLDNLPSF